MVIAIVIAATAMTVRIAMMVGAIAGRDGVAGQAAHDGAADRADHAAMRDDIAEYAARAGADDRARRLAALATSVGCCGEPAQQ